MLEHTLPQYENIPFRGYVTKML